MRKMQTPLVSLRYLLQSKRLNEINLPGIECSICCEAWVKNSNKVYTLNENCVENRYYRQLGNIYNSHVVGTLLEMR